MVLKRVEGSAWNNVREVPWNLYDSDNLKCELTFPVRKLEEIIMK